MTTQELNAALYDKMAGEQASFRAWLLQQEPEEILKHTYEYTVREDILMSMEYHDLPERQAALMLTSPTPLADVFKLFSNLETDYMDMVWDSLETHAKEVEQRRKPLRDTPVYPHSAAYAVEHGEIARYRASSHANQVCQKAVEETIESCYHGNRLDADLALAQLESQFGPERLKLILAVTVQAKEHDGRISPDNKAWAQSVSIPDDPNLRYCVVDQAHPGLVDLLIRRARLEFVQEKALPKKKSSIREKLQGTPDVTSPKNSAKLKAQER